MTARTRDPDPGLRNLEREQRARTEHRESGTANDVRSLPPPRIPAPS